MLNLVAGLEVCACVSCLSFSCSFAHHDDASRLKFPGLRLGQRAGDDVMGGVCAPLLPQGPRRKLDGWIVNIGCWMLDFECSMLDARRV